MSYRIEYCVCGDGKAVFEKCYLNLASAKKGVCVVCRDCKIRGPGKISEYSAELAWNSMMKDLKRMRSGDAHTIIEDVIKKLEK